MHALKLLPTVYMATGTPATSPRTNAPVQVTAQPPRADSAPSGHAAPTTAPRPR